MLDSRVDKKNKEVGKKKNVKNRDSSRKEKEENQTKIDRFNQSISFVVLFSLSKPYLPCLHILSLQ